MSTIGLDGLREMQQNGNVSVDEVAEAIRAKQARGEPLDDKEEAFVPFDPFVTTDASRLPTFPIQSLPPVLRYMAKSAAENLQVAVDMTAVAGLAIASLCIQGKFIINPKPGWIEQLNLYAAVIAHPSDRKTPAMSVMARPLHAFDTNHL